MAAGAAETILAGQPVFGEMTSGPALQTYSLPPLPYGYNALEPHISAEIMTLHHDRHHQAYVTNLNAALTNYSAAAANGRVADQLALLPTLRFNGGGHVNHALFWPSLAPAKSVDARDPEGRAPKLTAALADAFGSVEGFTAALSKALLGIQGSGWGWLVKSTKEPKGQLQIVTTKDQDPVTDAIPILGIDMWEHAYYLQYQNGKQSYVENVWQIINWTTAESRYTGTREDVFDGLQVTLS